jgi:hypothetical protein
MLKLSVTVLHCRLRAFWLVSEVYDCGSEILGGKKARHCCIENLKPSICCSFCQVELYPLDHSDFVTFCRSNTALLFDTEAGGGGGAGAGAGGGEEQEQEEVLVEPSRRS